MSQPLASVADRLFELVIDLDPARATWERLRDSARERARVLAQEIDALLGEPGLAALEASAGRARAALMRAKTNLSALVEALNNGKNAREWRRIYGRLAKDYEELVRAMRESRVFEGITFKRLAPANYVRNAFHVLSGIFAALTYHYLIDRTGALIIMTTLVVTFTTLEILRRYSTATNDLLMRFPFFKHVARAHEYYRVNSATYYAWGLLIATIFTPAQAVEAGCLVLAFGDPVASNLGRRYGKKKLFRDKSIVGTVSFFFAAFVVLAAYLVIFFPAQPMSLVLVLAGVGASSGALAEALTARLDDNLTVPLSVALSQALVLWLALPH